MNYIVQDSHILYEHFGTGKRTSVRTTNFLKRRRYVCISQLSLSMIQIWITCMEKKKLHMIQNVRNGCRWISICMCAHFVGHILSKETFN